MFKVGEREARTINFDEIEVGWTTSFQHAISQDDVLTFAKLTGDFNPLHLNEEFARKTAFGKPVVYGMLSASFISTMIGMLVPGKGALWTSQTLEFLKPAFVGDTITVSATVKQKSVATRVLVLDVAIVNQHRQTLISGSSNVRLLKLEESVATPKKNRTILITGASRGIGAASAMLLASRGHSILLNYHSNENEAHEVARAIQAAGGNARTIRADVSDLIQVEHLVAEGTDAFGAIDGFVHCASPPTVPQPFSETSWQNVQQHLDTQLRGAFNCAQLLLPKMAENKSGSIVFLGSIYSDGVPPTQLMPYIVTKAALSAFARSLAVEYGPKGIRVNVLSPGMTQTSMIANVPDKTKMLTKMQTPLRRLAEPQDVANSVDFLMSDAATHITGETLRVCGGITMV